MILKVVVGLLQGNVLRRKRSSMPEYSDRMVKPLIEEQLPKQFIYDLGVYLQTCAHIELAVCELIVTIEFFPENNSVITKRLHELRKLAIKDLVSELRNSSGQVQDDWSNYLVELSDWVGRYKENRHIAAHGAFYREIDTENIRVFYTHKRKDHGVPVYYPEETVITRKLVLDFIEDADRILRTLVSLSSAIKRGDVRVSSKGV